jgi:hypothetical protein
VNRVFVRLGNEPVPTGQRGVGAKLLSFENRHFSDQTHGIVALSNSSP